MKTKIISILTVILFLNIQLSYADNNPVRPKKSAVVYPNAAHDALIVKSVKSQLLQLINEEGEIVFEKTVNKGTNSYRMRNLKLGRYKLILLEEEEKTETTLVVR